MALKSDLAQASKDILKIQWAEREPKSILPAESVTLGGDAIKYPSAAVLYADIDQSTDLVSRYQWTLVAEVFKAFLYCSSRLIVHFGGAITSYDGDRVMGIFLGEHPATNAVKCALNINYARVHIINPAIKAQYPATDFQLKTVTGVDFGLIRGIRTGARGNNDLAWIGRAPNLAAKLTTMSSDYPTWITNTVYDRLPDAAKIGEAGKSMWEKRLWTSMDNMEIYRSNFLWDTEPTK